MAPGATTVEEVNKTMRAFKLQVHMFFIIAIICTMLLLLEISILCYIDYFRYELTRRQVNNGVVISNILGIAGNVTFELVIIKLLAKGNSEFAATTEKKNDQTSEKEKNCDSLEERASLNKSMLQTSVEQLP